MGTKGENTLIFHKEAFLLLRFGLLFWKFDRLACFPTRVVSNSLVLSEICTLADVMVADAGNTTALSEVLIVRRKSSSLSITLSIRASNMRHT